MVDSWYGIVVLSGNILCSLSYVLYQEFEARCRGWKKKNVQKSQLWFQLVAMKKLRGKLTRHALNQLVSIFLVKVKRMRFNNIFDKTPVKFIILMKGTKTGFIMGWCKCSRKRCITSCFRFMQLRSHIILFFCPRKYEFLYSGVLSSFFSLWLSKPNLSFGIPLDPCFPQTFYKIKCKRWSIKTLSSHHLLSTLPPIFVVLIHQGAPKKSLDWEWWLWRPGERDRAELWHGALSCWK